MQRIYSYQARLLALAAIALLAGCASRSTKMNKLVLGMPREDVVRIMGKPHAVSAQGHVEYLTYNLVNRGGGDMQPYTVRLINDRVEAFGEKSDFSTAKFGPLPAGPGEARKDAAQTNSPHQSHGATASNPPTNSDSNPR
ncbi:MAG TPA: outer membrane protein assembly factor BamE [Methylomirabilota bacterium]|nr:outer membrane protein assembly factor BamE [Methylomirabilota bacterium]